jgi:hypothetical protein
MINILKKQNGMSIILNKISLNVTMSLTSKMNGCLKKKLTFMCPGKKNMYHYISYLMIDEERNG